MSKKHDEQLAKMQEMFDRRVDVLTKTCDALHDQLQKEMNMTAALQAEIVELKRQINNDLGRG